MYQLVITFRKSPGIGADSHMYPNVHSSAFNNSQIMERAQMSINWWMDKEDVVYIYNEVLLGNEKEWNPAICNNVDGTGGYYAKWNKSVRERQISYVFTHMWDLRNLAEDHEGREGEKIVSNRKGGKPIRDSWIQRTNQGLMGRGAGERGKWVMSVEEGTWDEHWVLSLSDESPGSSPKTKSTLYTLYVS